MNRMRKKKCAAIVCALLGSAVLAMQADAAIAVDKWTRITIDGSHSRGFGYDYADVNGDGLLDICGNRNLYINPGGTMDGGWKKSQPFGGDASLFLDVNKDNLPDVIAMNYPNVYLYIAQDKAGNYSQKTIRSDMPRGNGHQNGQGQRLAQIVAGGLPEVVLASGSSPLEVFCLSVPSNPEQTWPKVTLTNSGTDEDVGTGDIDGDGDIDIACMAGSFEALAWFENPGNGSGNWTKHMLPNTNNYNDRCHIVDIDGDGYNDVLISGAEGGTSNESSWMENPRPNDPKVQGNWKRHIFVKQSTTHSMQPADFDMDGDVDIVTGVTVAPLDVKIHVNDGKGNFTAKKIGTGDFHNTLEPADLDGDGDLDLTGVGWFDHSLRLFRNDANPVVKTILMDYATPDDFGWSARSLGNGEMYSFSIPVAGPYVGIIMDARGRVWDRWEGYGPQECVRPARLTSAKNMCLLKVKTGEQTIVHKIEMGNR